MDGSQRVPLSALRLKRPGGRGGHKGREGGGGGGRADAPESGGGRGRGRGSGKQPKPKREFRRKPKKFERDADEIARLESSYAQDYSAVTLFSQLPLSSATAGGLKSGDFVRPTEIQRQAIPLALRGRDVLGAAKTGSGKTLAFLVPLLERLFTLRWSRDDGLGALVITPTRELALQIFEMLRKVGKGHDFSAGLVIGGKDLQFESRRMAQCNIVICTPGRLLQHMDENPQFDALSLKMLILDEADRCLEMGFSTQMNAIVANLPSSSDRQTLLFSATQTRSIKDLARLSLCDPVYVSVDEHASKATPDRLSEHYLVCPLERKLELLWSFIKSHRKKKVLVFVQCCKQAKYYTDLLKRLRSPTQVLALYGTLNQLRRMALYKEFCAMEKGVLIATDIAARGLDFPTVDWVYQLDCPEDWKVYNHRVGRTARNQANGEALLCLMPSEEEAMLRQLRAHKFPIEKIEVNERKVVSMQRKIEASLAGDGELKETAKRAFVHYLKSVFLMRDKSIFDVTKLDRDAFAASLGLVVAPKVRFVDKKLKEKGTKKEDVIKEKKEEGVIKEEERPRAKATLLAASDSEDDDDGDDIMTVKRRDHALAGDDGENDDDDDLIMPTSNKSKRVVTKAAVAKKLLRKNATANQKVKFDDDGQALPDEAELHKVSEEGRKFELGGAEEEEEEAGAGIDFERARRVMRAEDAFDRKKEKERVKARHKEQKRKEKEVKARRGQDEGGEGGGAEEEDYSDSESDGPDLGMLPDPDKIYGRLKESDDVSESEEETGSSSSEEEESAGKKRKWKPPKKKKVAAKKPRRDDDDDADDEDLDHLADDEQLALQLLRQ